MKKSITFILLSVALLTYSGKCNAQFFKKLGKSIEKVSKEVDKTLGTEESVKTSDSENNNSKIIYSTPHKNLQLNLIGATMNGDYYVLEFTITNKGDDIKDYRLSGYGSGSADAYDNLGNQCRVDIIFGRNESWHGGSAGGSLLNDTPIKIKVLLSRFSSKANSFSQIKIKGEAWDHGMTNRPNGYFVFKNVPIIKNEGVEATIPVKRTDIPIEEKNVPQFVEKKPVPQKIDYEQKNVLPLSSLIKTSSFPKTVEFRELCDLGYWKVMGITCIRSNRFKIKVKGLKDSRQFTPGQCSLSIDQATKGSFGIRKAYTGAYNFPRIQEGEVREFEIVTAAPHSEFAGFVIYKSKMGSPYEIQNPYDSRWKVVN